MYGREKVAVNEKKKRKQVDKQQSERETEVEMEGGEFELLQPPLPLPSSFP